MTTLARISTAEFERMIQHGVFDEEEGRTRRIELIFGELREQMVPPNPPHEGTIDWLNRWSINNTDGDNVVVRIQNTIGMSALDSIPLPDIAWLDTQANYRQVRPQPDNVLLVVEVSDTSLRYDLKTKAKLYAEAGVQDYWVVDVNALVVHVHRKPRAGAYQSIVQVPVGESLTPLADKDVTLSVSDLFAHKG